MASCKGKASHNKMASSKKRRTQLSNAEKLEIDRHAHENQLSHVDAAYWYNSAHPRTICSPQVETQGFGVLGATRYLS